MKKAIIFDYGGVIKNETDSFILGDIAEKFNVELNIVVSAMNKLTNKYQKGKISDEEFWNKLSQELGRDLPENYENLLLNKYISKGKINKNILQVIEELKRKGYKTACLSNTIPPHAKFNKRQGNYNIFDVVVLSCEVGMQKPDEKIYKLIIEKLGINSQNCIYIDDKEENLKPAEKLGMKTIHYKDQTQLKLQLPIK